MNDTIGAPGYQAQRPNDSKQPVWKSMPRTESFIHSYDQYSSLKEVSTDAMKMPDGVYTDVVHSIIAQSK